jgi:chitinase
LGKFFPEQIDPFLCTHVIYSFAKVTGNSLAPYEWNDLSEPWMRGMYERTIDLKKQNPSLKVLLAVGGWTHGSGPFSVMVNNPTSRAAFVQNAKKYIVQNKFDGLDLDWEYPGSRENSQPSDKQAFTELCKELSAAFKPDNLLLTAAVAAGKSTIDAGYEIDKISKYLDFINLMAYVKYF